MWLGAYQEIDGDFPAGGGRRAVLGAGGSAAAATAAPRGLRGRRVLSATTSAAAAAAASARCAVSAQLPPLFRLTAQTFSAQSASRFISQVATFHFNRVAAISRTFGVAPTLTASGTSIAPLSLALVGRAAVLSCIWRSGHATRTTKKQEPHFARSNTRGRAQGRLSPRSAGGWRLRRKEAAAGDGSRRVLGPRVRE